MKIHLEDSQMSNVKKHKVSQQRLTIILIVIIGFFLGAVIYIFKQMSLEDEPPKQTTTHVMDSGAVEEEPIKETSLCVVKEVDTEKKTILLYDIDRDCTVKVAYTGITDIRDEYSQVIAASQLVISSIVEASYEESNQMLSYLMVSKNAWVYHNVTGLNPDRENKIIKLYGQKYKYTSKLFVRDADGESTLLSINSDDVLTIRGYDKTIYSITVTRGHGTLVITNAEYFEGGTLTIYGKEYGNLTSNMAITVREGTAEIEIQKDDVVESTTLNILRNQENELDLSKFQPSPEEKGEVTFIIRPFGAELYIDDILTSYANAIELSYGDHLIEVNLNGYESYQGIYTLMSSTDVVQIELPETVKEEMIEEDDGDSTNSDSSSSTTTESSSNASSSSSTNSSSSNSEDEQSQTESEESESREVDEEHTISIHSPSGVSVYINGTYKGIAPLTLEKPIGRTYITLLEEGYEQITHTVNIEDDGEDKYYTFPNLVLIEEEEE